MLSFNNPLNNQDDLKEKILDLLIGNILKDVSVNYSEDLSGGTNIRVTFEVVKPATRYAIKSPVGNA